MGIPAGPLTYTHTQVACGAATTELAAANPRRLYLRIENISDELVSIKFGAAAVATEGILLQMIAAAGHLASVYEVSEAKGNLSTQAINGICASGAKNVNVTSGE